MKLLGKNALITGGSQGLGRVIVEAFLSNGANVIFCARTAADINQTQAALASLLQPCQQLVGCVADVANPSNIAALFARAAQLGPLDVLVNNAGIYGPIGHTEKVSLAEWTEAWQINVTGTLLACQHAISAMKPQCAGKIINISGGGATNPMPRFAAYAACKAAVVRLTETLAEEYRADHIDVNAVAPGALRTRLTEQVLAAGPDKAGADFFIKIKKCFEEGATDAKLAASLCVFLASSDSDGITGKLISAVWDKWQDWPNHIKELQASDVYTLRRIIGLDRGYEWGDK